MSQIFSSETYNLRTSLLLLLIILGLIASRALISIATGLLLVNLLLDENRIINLRSILSHKVWFVFLTIPLVILLYIPFAENTIIGLESLFRKLPFVAIPMAIAAMKPDKKLVHTLLSLFILILVVSAIVVLFNYFVNLDFYTDAIRKGKSIPMPHNHIRFSLMISFACLLSFHFFYKKIQIQYTWEPIFYLVTALLLFVTSHILSVRSGLFTLYLGSFFYLFYLIINSKKYVAGIVIFAAVLSVPFIAYQTIPSFTNRIDYMKYDYQQMQKGIVGHNSDARRMRSYSVGWQVAKDNMPFGTGLGGLKPAIEASYETEYTNVAQENRKMPHNQFLWTFVELGIIGLVALALFLVTPLLYINWFDTPLFIVLFIIIGSSLLVEATFETQLGITIYCLFGSLILKNDLEI